MPATSFFNAGVRPFPLCCFVIDIFPLSSPLRPRFWPPSHTYPDINVAIHSAITALAFSRCVQIAAATIQAGLQYKVILTMMVGNTPQRLYCGIVLDVQYQ
ncbi:hypothetical protein C8F04DRAFT_1182371 [Mycena alexandri]|uniref:Uncharacterized protein n=1 Tax=Mycena alexandri TaxID=1745969 RepID=A0AAD6X7Z3_9AGAR|nr:hypothetical protein C8F04DRAFT_1182371 [Mycena alexandri]